MENRHTRTQTHLRRKHSSFMHRIDLPAEHSGAALILKPDGFLGADIMFVCCRFAVCMCLCDALSNNIKQIYMRKFL